MTLDQIEIVQNSFAKVVPAADEAGMLFYRRLFEIAPDTRMLFADNISEQSDKLMSMLKTVIGDLHQIDKVLPSAQALGRHHVKYGVKDKHYDQVGEALIWAIGQKLYDDFTPEVKEAWGAAYGTLADVMKEAGAATEPEKKGIFARLFG